MSNPENPIMAKVPREHLKIDDLVVLMIGLFLAAVILMLLGCGERKHPSSFPNVEHLLPELPDLTHVNPELRERVLQANDQAQRGEQRVEAWVELSRLYHANGFLQESIACYEALLQLDPENPRWMHLLAFLLATYGYADDAEGLWRDMLQLDPNYTPASIRLADVLLKSNRPGEAEEVYRDVLEKEPRNPYALLGLGRVAIAMDDWESARSHLEGASRHSDGKIGRDLLVNAYENLGQQSLALAIRGEARAAGTFVDIPDAWLVDVMHDCYDVAQVMNTGGLAAFGGNFHEGIRWSQRALELDPENASAHFQIAQMYLQARDLPNAMRHFETCIQLKPDFADAWLRMVDIEELRGNRQRADEHFFSGFMKCPNSPAFNLEYGMRLARQGQAREALPYLRKSIELNPNEAPAYVQLASAYFALGRDADGRAALEKALLVEAGNPLAMLTLCFVYIQTGEQELARQLLESIRAHPRISAADKLEMRLKFQEHF
jgi:tetratricopeptide (TPR) repeat protein